MCLSHVRIESRDASNLPRVLVGGVEVGFAVEADSTSSASRTFLNQLNRRGAVWTYR